MVMAALGGSVARGERQASPGHEWARIAAGLRPALDRRSANPCQRGDLGCYDIVLREMRRRAAALAARCDHNLLFAQIYVRTTETIRAAARVRELHDARSMSHSTAWFAHYYFSAYDNWRAGRRSAAPPAWRIAFDAARGRRVRGLGDLLLGMNAHISRDLANVAAEAFPPAAGTAVDPDFLFANRLIERVTPSALREITARFDPSVAAGQIPVTLGRGRSFTALITRWRDDAWRDGQALRRASAGKRASISRRIEEKAGLRAAAILASTSYLPFVESSKNRDAYCAAHRGKG
jgi:hypothetical protein